MAYDPFDPNSQPDQPYEPAQPEAAQPSYADFQRDYWAPDRAAVLAQMAPSPGAPTMGPQLPTMGTPSPNTGVTGGRAPLAPSPRQSEDSWIGWLQSQTSPERNAAKQGIYQSRPGSGFYHTGGTSTADAVTKYNTDTGSHAKYIGGPSGDMVDFGDGRGPVDVHNAEGNFWYDEGKGANRIANAGSGPGAGVPGPNPGGQGTGGGPLGSALGIGGWGMGTGAASYGVTSDALQRQYRDTLLRMMQQGEQPVDENSLGIKQPYEAARLASERQLEQAQQANAERLYGQGQLGSNELAQMNQQGRERAAVGLAGVKSGLVQGEIGARRQQLQQALQLANAVGARQEAIQLQRELAQLENQYRYSALGQQRDIWNDQYGLQRAAYLQGMNERGTDTAFGNEGG